VAVALDKYAVDAGEGDFLVVGSGGECGGVELRALALGTTDGAVNAVDGALVPGKGFGGGGVDACGASEVPGGDDGGIA
jgi:hypothetical protein